jgi:two-component system sensor histidine kinase RegB
MCADVALLSWLLLRAGGVLNPASVFYLVEIVVAALVFGRRWTWIVAVLAVVGYAASFLAPTDDLRAAQMMHPEIALHMRGMWLAFALTAVIIAALVTRLLGALERRDRALDLLRVRNEGAMRAASLATLAAGAAHELSTPLATIAVAARELERGLADSSNEGRDDARLIRDEAARCRAILDDLSGAAGQPSGEPPQSTSLMRVLEDVKARLASGDRDRLRIAHMSDAEVQWPIRPVERALANVIQNALQASGREVRIAVTRESNTLTIVVADDGPGMTAEQAARAGDPFYTTKAGGTGLGLFVTRSTIEQLGGTFRLATRPDAGTAVTMTLPVHVGR